jgi:protocatechuate 3,4-dioxygenase beta subunit
MRLKRQQDPKAAERTAILVFLAIAALLSACLVSAATPAASSLTAIAPEEPETRLTVRGTVVDGRGHVVAGAQIHVYQTDATGWYTRERAMDEPHARLAGWLRTDAQGRFEVYTIRPGGYPKALRLGDRDRKIPAHIHMDISAAGFAQLKLQCVFADDPLLADPYWKEWVHRLGQPVLTVQPSGNGQATTLQIELRS